MPGRASDEPAPSSPADDFFQSLSLPYSGDLADGPGLEDADNMPWASEPTSAFDAPEDPESRRAHFVGEPMPVRQRRVPKPVIGAVVGLAAIVVLVLGLVATGGDSPDVVRATPRRVATRPIPTLPPQTVVTEVVGTLPVEDTVPATLARRPTASRSAPVVEEPTPQETLPPTNPPAPPPPPPPSPVAPGVPTGVTAAPGAVSGQVVVSWAAPTSNGGSAITGYEVTHYDGNAGGLWVSPVSAGLGLSYTVNGLIDDTAYQFQVRAINGVGAGSWSASASATPVTPVTPTTVADPAPTTFTGAPAVADRPRFVSTRS